MSSRLIGMPLEIRRKIWAYAFEDGGSLPKIRPQIRSGKCIGCNIPVSVVNGQIMSLLLAERALGLDAQDWLFDNASEVLFDNYDCFSGTLATKTTWGPLRKAEIVRVLYYETRVMAIGMKKEVLRKAREFKEKMNNMYPEDRTEVHWEAVVCPDVCQGVKCFSIELKSTGM